VRQEEDSLPWDPLWDYILQDSELDAEKKARNRMLRERARMKGMSSKHLDDESHISSLSIGAGDSFSLPPSSVVGKTAKKTATRNKGPKIFTVMTTDKSTSYDDAREDQSFDHRLQSPSHDKSLRNTIRRLNCVKPSDAEADSTLTDLPRTLYTISSPGSMHPIDELALKICSTQSQSVDGDNAVLQKPSFSRSISKGKIGKALAALTSPGSFAEHSDTNPKSSQVSPSAHQSAMEAQRSDYSQVQLCSTQSYTDQASVSKQKGFLSRMLNVHNTDDYDEASIIATADNRVPKASPVAKGKHFAFLNRRNSTDEKAVSSSQVNQPTSLVWNSRGSKKAAENTWIEKMSNRPAVSAEKKKPRGVRKRLFGRRKTDESEISNDSFNMSKDFTEYIDKPLPEQMTYKKSIIPDLEVKNQAEAVEPTVEASFLGFFTSGLKASNEMQTQTDGPPIVPEDLEAKRDDEPNLLDRWLKTVETYSSDGSAGNSTIPSIISDESNHQRKKLPSQAVVSPDASFTDGSEGGEESSFWNFFSGGSTKKSAAPSAAKQHASQRSKSFFDYNNNWNLDTVDSGSDDSRPSTISMLSLGSLNAR
jgi:hypothetical protein